MERIATVSLILVFALAILTGCRQQPQALENTQIGINLVTDPAPPILGEAALLITVTDTNGNPISDALVEVRGDMTHAGMVPVLVSTDEGLDGVYRIPFEWTMGGDWLVDVTVTLANGQAAQKQFEYVVTAGSEMEMDEMDMPEMTPQSEPTD